MNEISAIQADLQRHIQARDEAQRAISELQLALTVLARYAPGADVPAGAPASAPVLAPLPQINGPKLGPRGVAQIAATMMATGPVWRQLSELCDQLLAADTKIGGADPLNNLSTIMSRNKAEFKFLADKRKGWALQSRVDQHDGLEGGGLLGKIATE